MLKIGYLWIVVQLHILRHISGSGTLFLPYVSIFAKPRVLSSLCFLCNKFVPHVHKAQIYLVPLACEDEQPVENCF